MSPRVFRIALLVAIVLGSLTMAHAQEATAPARPTPALVNLNTADAAQLEALPGIGPRTAQRIIEYRQKNGPFRKIEELMNVQGIGEKSFLRLKPYLTVSPPRPEKPAGIQS